MMLMMLFNTIQKVEGNEQDKPTQQQIKHKQITNTRQNNMLAFQFDDGK